MPFAFVTCVILKAVLSSDYNAIGFLNAKKGLKIAFALVTTRIATRKKAPFLCVQEPGREGDYIIYKKGPWKGLTQVTTLAHGGWVANTSDP